jgi:subtilase family serine protease
MKPLKNIIWTVLFAVFLFGLCPLTLAAQKPDLTVVQMEVKPPLADRLPGRYVTLKAMIFNKGNAAAPPSRAVIKISTTTSPPFYIGALEPNKGQTIYVNNIKLNNPGTYTALFEADIENTVNESDEANNEQPLTFTVRAINPPDLSVKNIKIGPANPTTKDTIRFSAAICNAGDEATPKFKDSIRIGGESTPMVGNPRSIPGPYCAPAQRLMKITEAGNYRVTIKTDIDNAVPESNESNNEAFLDFTVKAAKPDLAVRDMKMTPVHPTIEDTITFSAEVVSIGTLPGPAGKAGIRVGGESTPVLYYFPYVFGNQPFKFSRQIKLDREGNYKVVFIADVEKTIDELDESNNEGSLSFTVRKLKSDLTFRNLKIEPANPKVNQNIRFSAELVNIGQAPCPPTSNGTQVGGESSPNLGTYGTIPVDSPAATKYAVARVMKFTKPGNYIATFIADAKNQADESNEGNNQIQLHFTVK